MSSQQETREQQILRGRAILFRNGRYVVVRGDLPADTHYEHIYRVVNLESGDESNLYSMLACEEIIDHALAGRLLGSFDL